MSSRYRLYVSSGTQEAELHRIKIRLLSRLVAALAEDTFQSGRFSNPVAITENDLPAALPPTMTRVSTAPCHQRTFRRLSMNGVIAPVGLQ